MRLYVDHAGPTPDRLGPNGKTGSYFAWGALRFDNHNSYPNSVVVRGKTEQECRDAMDLIAKEVGQYKEASAR